MDANILIWFFNIYGDSTNCSVLVEIVLVLKLVEILVEGNKLECVADISSIRKVGDFLTNIYAFFKNVRISITLTDVVSALISLVSLFFKSYNIED